MEIVVGILIFIVLLCALFDLLILSWKFAVISQTSSNVARVVGLQGGAASSAPHGFPGGNGSYVNAATLRGNVDDIFARGDIATSEYRFTLNGTPLGSPLEVDYRGLIEVNVEVDYQWKFLSGVLPINPQSRISTRRVAMSEFKYRYDSWIGE